MDNCDLERLSVSVGKLQPNFSPNVTTYQVEVESSVDKVVLDLATSDCGASYRIRFGDESRSIKLSDGLNKVEIEVVAEDGTIKKYYVGITKLSAKIANLTQLSLDGPFPLYPNFNSKTLEYFSTVPYHVNSVTLLPNAPDKHIRVKVNGGNSSQPVLLNYGDTAVEISVCSADGTHSQVYTVLVTRELIPLTVTFTNVKDQFEFECPVSLNASYRPLSISDSDPKQIFSRPYIEMLARRSKVNPFSNKPLPDTWKKVEMDLDRKMSTTPVKCLFTYKGCDTEVKLAELGSHLSVCSHKPTGELNEKDVTETKWFKEHFQASSSLQINTKHSLEVHNWEYKLALEASAESSVEKLCVSAEDELKVYKEHLPKPGDLIQYQEGMSPLSNLEQAAIHLASAIRLSSKESRLHFLLGSVLEEQYYAIEMYGLQKKVDKDSKDESEAKATSRQDDILAVCKLHGFLGTPTVEKRLQALDKEYHQLKDQGQLSKADYVQTLYLWLSKRTGKDNSVALRDEQNCLSQALTKYLDAWSLSPDCWEYNLHVGRLLLLQGRPSEALQHLQTGLALRPLHPGLRFFTGLALLQQEAKASEDTEKEAALFLHQGLEHFIGQRCRESWKELFPSEPLSGISAQFLRGLLTLGQLQHKNTIKENAMSADQVYHIVAALAAQSVSQCVCIGEASSQLEWVLLDSHFVLLQRLIHKVKAGADTKSLVAKRCQAIIALIRLTSITPCQELLDMQENVCQLAVTISPRDNYTLCLLGMAQLAQYDSNPKSTGSQEVLADACASFQASINLEGKPQKGDPPEELSKQKWWLDRQQIEQEKTAKSAPSQPQVVRGPPTTGAAARGAGQGRVQPGKGQSTAPHNKAPAPRTPARGGKTAPTTKTSAAPATKTSAAPTTKTSAAPTTKTSAAPATRTSAAPATKTSAAPATKTSAAPATKTSAAPATKTSATPVARGRPGVTARSSNNSNKRQLSTTSKSKQECSVKPADTVTETAVKECVSEPCPVNPKSLVPRLGLARALCRLEKYEQAKALYQDVISMSPEVHDAYIELAQLMEPSDPQAVVEMYCSYPQKPVAEQSFDDAFITGEIVRILMKLELYDHPQLGSSLVAYGKVMGLSCIETYIHILDEKSMTKLLRSVYAKVHDRPEDDPDLLDFFRFKCWM